MIELIYGDGNDINIGDMVSFHGFAPFKVVSVAVDEYNTTVFKDAGHGYYAYACKLVEVVKPKETFDEVADDLCESASVGAFTSRSDADQFGKRFLNCEEASHE